MNSIDRWELRAGEAEAAGRRVVLAAICETCQRRIPVDTGAGWPDIPSCECGRVTTKQDVERALFGDVLTTAQRASSRPAMSLERAD